MQNLLLPYLVGVASTVIVPVVALAAYIASHLKGREFDRMRGRLPLATRYEDLTARVRDLETRRDELNEQLNEAQIVISEAEREREWLERNAEEIAQMHLEQEKLAKHRLEYDEIASELADANEQLAAAERQRAEKLFQYEQLVSRIGTAEERVQAITEQVQVGQERLSKLETELIDTRQALDTARSGRLDAEKELAAARAELEVLSSRIKTMQQQRDELSNEVQLLSYKAEKLESSNSALEGQLDGLRNRVGDTQDLLKGLRAEAMKRGQAGAIGTADEAMCELWHPAITIKADSKEIEATEQAMLGRLQRYLDAHKLRFPKRVLLSFHTSLKIADQTPLLVLAGISGTGKSLLPRRYAEAMGIHFLSVPVQPRWDGPQDILGFFNYLENRYKATELLRALIQMDEYSRDWASDAMKDHWAGDRLLLVLLDEMNLAKVEYYFSEFLSRLETRRDIDVDNEIDRATASIPLDLGDVDTDAPPRVFVDRNVLFVGTMNEDESTMALSDKVIDRAGVMRFGRPSSLKREASESNTDLDKLRAKGHLGWNTWIDWINAGYGRTVQTELAEKVEQLNTAMARIGRPFGYRTRDAMICYVQQYPDHTDLGQRHALADQIEQRIMPRLRGLDLADDNAHEAVQGVQEVVKELDDQNLMLAIERAADRATGHMFAWAGVDRAGDE